MKQINYNTQTTEISEKDRKYVIEKIDDLYNNFDYSKVTTMTPHEVKMKLLDMIYDCTEKIHEGYAECQIEDDNLVLSYSISKWMVRVFMYYVAEGGTIFMNKYLRNQYEDIA